MSDHVNGDLGIGRPAVPGDYLRRRASGLCSRPTIGERAPHQPYPSARPGEAQMVAMVRSLEGCRAAPFDQTWCSGLYLRLVAVAIGE